MTQEQTDTFTPENLSAFGRAFLIPSVPETWTPGKSLASAFDRACADAEIAEASQLWRDLDRAVQRIYFPGNQLDYTKTKVAGILTQMCNKFSPGTENLQATEMTAAVLGVDLTQG